MYPLSLFLIVSARPFVAFFLTDKWLPAVPLMKIFFLEGFFFPLLMLNQNMFNAVGRSDISLKVDTVRKILMFLSIFIAFKYGVQALIFGQVLSSFITFVLSSIVIMSVNKINIKKQFKEIIYSLTIISILYLTFILLIDKYVIKSEFVLLANLILIPLIYLLLTRLVMKNNFTEFVLLISDLLPDKYRKFIHIK
jgi:O-antigen/teichoic acid export membrane protein